MYSQLFRRVVQTLVLDGGAAPAAFGEDVAIVVTDNGQNAVRVVQYHRDPDILFDRLVGHVEALAPGGDLVLVGGPDSAWDLLERARPSTTGVSLHHVTDDERVRQPSAGLLGKQRLESLARLRPPSAEDDAAFAAQMRDGVAAFGAQMNDLQDFSAAIATRRPWATWILVATCVVLFILQSVWTDSDLVAGYLRMGALPGNVFETGEWWRLFSATLLHGDAQHLLFNMFVLYSLGSFLERVVGTRRFLVLYGASALAGSLASAMFLAPERFSVGASGALWGILGADAVLAFVRTDLLPAAILPRARRAAGINLGLNLFVSFMPNIDMAAHFGGGLMGAALTFTGVLTLGITNVRARSLPTPPIALTAMGATLMLALAGSMGVALAQGQPWTLKSAVQLEATTVDVLKTRLDAPAGLTYQVRTLPDAPPSVTFGDTRRDGAAVDLIAFDLPTITPAAQAVEELKGVLKTPPVPGALMQGQARLEPEGVVQGHYVLKNGARLERAFRVDGLRMWRVDVIYHPSLNARWHGVAGRMAATAAPAP